MQKKPLSHQDSQAYLAKKAELASILTIYGRKPVLESLQTPGIKVERLHLSHRNKTAPILNQIISLAEEQGAQIKKHDPQALSRISKNAKQDQGVAADLRCPNFMTLKQITQNPKKQLRLIALDRITNPQNLGMIIRSATASQFDGVLIPRKGCAPLSPLVIKASAGTLLKAPIIQVDSLYKTLENLLTQGFLIHSLRLDAKSNLQNRTPSEKEIFVLGNETDGVSREIDLLAKSAIRIPMARGVESLNVAVTAALICFSE